MPQDPLRIVAIGGGTGLSTVLRGLKDYAHLPWYDSGKRLAPAGRTLAIAQKPSRQRVK